MCHYFKEHILIIAFICMGIAIFLGTFAFFLAQKTVLLGLGSILTTIASAIIVFSTFDLQRQALFEDRQNNRNLHFDSQFYPIASCFRTDAINMQITRQYLNKQNGSEQAKTFNGEMAFLVANQMIEILLNSIKALDYIAFDPDKKDAVLKEYDYKTCSLEDQGYSAFEDFVDIETERNAYIKSEQSIYLMYAFGITKAKKEKLMYLTDDQITSCLLQILLEKQSTTLTQYIQTLRFILHIIEKTIQQGDRHDYYLHVYCQLGKEELKFLNNFKEFDLITKVTI